MIDANARYVQKGRVIFLSGFNRNQGVNGLMVAIKLSMGHEVARFKVFDVTGSSFYINQRGPREEHSWHVYEGYPCEGGVKGFINNHVDNAIEFMEQAKELMPDDLYNRLFEGADPWSKD